MSTTNPYKHHFKVLEAPHNGVNYAYLDNGATTHKPQSVIDRMTQFYTFENATVHRGIYEQSQKATLWCDEVRTTAQAFINAPKSDEIIFVKGTTEALNLISTCYGLTHLKEGDEILISEMEHHANIVPWQEVCKKTGSQLVVCPILETGALNLDALQDMLKKGRVKIVSIMHVSNVLGTINPIKIITKWAHEAGAIMVVDGAQAIAHMSVDVQDLDCDFYCFSGHKMYGPTGIGILYGKSALLNKMDVYQTGGDMIDIVTFEKTTFAPIPAKFEAGTPAIAEIIGLGAAFSFITQIGFDAIHHIESELSIYLHEELKKIEGLKIYGTTESKAALASFNIQNLHPLDAGSILDKHGVAIRVGHHCAQPLHKKLGVSASMRASLSLYNTKNDCDQLIKGLKKVKDILNI